MTTDLSAAGYESFLLRLKGWERYEPTPHSRGPEKLSGLRTLLAQMGHPESRFKIVHIAGTNGKGMTAAMIDALLRDAGLRAARYTSPHLLELRERYCVDGTPLPPAGLTAAGHRVLDLAEPLAQHTRLAYFDVLTAIGFAAFAAAGPPAPEWLVLETGLGGLADATNVAPKVLAVITRIGWDHMGVLGDTLPAIAAQKLGIARAGVPLLIGQQPPELEAWLAAALARLPGPVHRCAALRLTWDVQAPGQVRLAARGRPALALDVPEVCCTPPRLENAATALAAAALLLGPADGATLRRRARVALEVPVPGRLDLRHDVSVQTDPPVRLATVLLDGGHNAEALAALAAQLTRWGIAAYTLVFGMQQDKWVPQVEAPLRRLLGGAAEVLALSPRGPRASTPQELAQELRRMLQGLSPAPEVIPCGDAREALGRAARTPGRPLVVAGSFWMLGDVLALLGAGGTPRPAA